MGTDWALRDHFWVLIGHRTEEDASQPWSRVAKQTSCNH